MKTLLIIKALIIMSILMTLPAIAANQPIPQNEIKDVEELIFNNPGDPPLPTCIIWILRQLRRVAILFGAALGAVLGLIYVIINAIRNNTAVL